jgi:hypothetical protein
VTLTWLENKIGREKKMEIKNQSSVPILNRD